MNIKLYHGSDHIVEQPKYNFGKRTNDYGQGFYCTEQIELAKEWSVGKEKNGFVNAYSIDLSKLKVLNLNDSNYSVLHWITMLIQNRVFDVDAGITKAGKEYLIKNFSINSDEYDIVIGYRADDSYFLYAQDFLNNTIPIGILEKALRLGNLGEQVVLKSEKAFQSICFIESEPIDSAVWFPKKEERDSKARAEYRDMRNDDFNVDDIFLMDIIRAKMEAKDVRI